MTDDSRSKAVSILISRDAPFELSEEMCDPEGRFVFLKESYGGTPITLANVYFPNRAHVSFCHHIIRERQGFAARCLILGGGRL